MSDTTVIQAEDLAQENLEGTTIPQDFSGIDTVERFLGDDAPLTNDIDGDHTVRRRASVHGTQQQQIDTLVLTPASVLKLYGNKSTWTVLGEGSFGTAYSVYNALSKRTVVLKELPKGATADEKQEVRDKLVQEVAVLKRVKARGCEPFSLCFEGVIDTPAAYYIRTEFLGRYDTLQSALSKGWLLHDSPKRMALRVGNLIRGLRQIHAAGIAHRDVKPGNVMVERHGAGVKYLDFGEACIETECVYNEPRGSPLYMAREVWQTVNPKQKLVGLKPAQKADLWALGVTLWEMLYGYLYRVRDPQLVDLWKDRLYESYKQRLAALPPSGASYKTLATELETVKRKTRFHKFGIILVFLDAFSYAGRHDPLASENEHLRQTLAAWSCQWSSETGSLYLDTLLVTDPARRLLPAMKSAPKLPPKAPVILRAPAKGGSGSGAPATFRGAPGGGSGNRSSRRSSRLYGKLPASRVSAAPV